MTVNYKQLKHYRLFIILFVGTVLSLYVGDRKMAAVLILIILLHFIGNVVKPASFKKAFTELSSIIIRLAALLYLVLLGFVPQIGAWNAAVTGIALATALVPIGLFLKPNLIMILSVARSALTTSSAQFFTILFGLIALAATHFAPAILPIQIVAIDLLALLLPIAALAHDESPDRVRSRLLTRATTANVVGFGLLAALLTYGNYLWFFVRHSLSPMFIEPSLPLYQQATSLTFITLVLCAYIYILVERADTHGKVWTFHLLSNNQLLKSLAGSLFLVGVIIYHPWFQQFFDTQSLDALDWLSAIACAGIFLLLRISQRHTRKHSRKAVLDLHRQVHKAKL